MTTYGDVADVAGYPKQARLVGRILATTDVEVPWWRVVNAAGRIVSGHPDEQAELLRAEGVVVVDQRVTDAPVGRFRRSRVWSAVRAGRHLTLDLHERQPDVVERVLHRGSVLAQPRSQPVDQAGDGVDRQRGLAQIGGIRRQVDRSRVRTDPSHGS